MCKVFIFIFYFLFIGKNNFIEKRLLYEEKHKVTIRITIEKYFFKIMKGSNNCVKLLDKTHNTLIILLNYVLEYWLND